MEKYEIERRVSENIQREMEAALNLARLQANARKNGEIDLADKESLYLPLFNKYCSLAEDISTYFVEKGYSPDTSIIVETPRHRVFDKTRYRSPKREAKEVWLINRVTDYAGFDTDQLNLGTDYQKGLALDNAGGIYYFQCIADQTITTKGNLINLNIPVSDKVAYIHKALNDSPGSFEEILIRLAQELLLKNNK